MSLIQTAETHLWQNTDLSAVASETTDFSEFFWSATGGAFFGRHPFGVFVYDQGLSAVEFSCPPNLLDRPPVADPPFPPIWPFFYDTSLIYGRDNVNQVHTFTRGDDYEFTAIVARNGTRVNLTGATLTLTAKWSLKDAGSIFTCSIGDGITVTSATNGEYTVVIAGSKTSGLPTALVRLPYDIQLVEGSGKKSTIMNGVLKIRPDATLT